MNVDELRRVCSLYLVVFCCFFSLCTQKRCSRNCDAIQKAKEDPHGETLLRHSQEDAKLGRMRDPCILTAGYAQEVNLAPRFGVVQGELLHSLLLFSHFLFILCAGLLPDGGCKVRPVDDFSFSYVNMATEPTDKLRCDTLDILFESLRCLASETKVRCSFDFAV